jgi:homeobox protein cut-like
MVIRVKSLLAENNIAQKVFGKYVLCLSQGSVSEIMNKPKPWHMLSIKGREPYVRMQMWLKDPNNIEKLKQVRNDNNLPQHIMEVPETNKICEDSGRPSDATSLSPSPHIRSHSTSTAENSFDECYNDKSIPDTHKNIKNDINIQDNDDDLNNALTAKRQRMDEGNCDAITMVSSEQHNVLMEAFSFEPNPNPIFIEYLSKHLKINCTILANWFRAQRLLSSKSDSSPISPIDETITENENGTGHVKGQKESTLLTHKTTSENTDDPTTTENNETIENLDTLGK